MRGNGLFDLHMSLNELEIQLSYHFAKTSQPLVAVTGSRC